MSKSTSNYMFDNRGLAFHGVLGGLQKKFSLAIGEISEICGRDLRPGNQRFVRQIHFKCE